MSYQSRIRDIQSAFVMGYHDRETCIEMFETLLHEFGFLPPTETLDRAITNENFLALLKAAKDGDKHRMQMLDAQAKQHALDHGMESSYRIADSIKQRCPVCQKPIRSLFNRVQSLDNQVLPVDPPRCQECMFQWVKEHFGEQRHSQVEAVSNASIDRSPASPMSPSEFDFFAEYEKQMAQGDDNDRA
jgi:hypothetical protein